MKIASIQFSPWDKISDFCADGFDLSIGDRVIVKDEFGLEIGEVVGLQEVDGVVASAKAKPEGGCPGCGACNNDDGEIKPIIRKADKDDLKKLASKKDKEEAMKKCRELAKVHGLTMKLVDVRFSFDGSKITFAFISEGRVDFRNLVRDLTQQFNRTIRLQQIGIRDEAKFAGEYGPCGRPLCCRNFLNDLVSITSEMAEAQQATHRGSEKISGMCGRLMCCLAYEHKGYCEMAKKMPRIGEKIKVKGRQGVVIGLHILKNTMDVEMLERDNGDNGRRVIEVGLNEIT